MVCLHPVKVKTDAGRFKSTITIKIVFSGIKTPINIKGVVIIIKCGPVGIPISGIIIPCNSKIKLSFKFLPEHFATDRIGRTIRRVDI